ncbi:MAG: hypothetical protein L0332_23300 [Chloroflexi bacterium]|nr:hypothetical protein [Chloroflexota bacterium]MCI0729618.1 hypothetical protein [Chloroflexota bacterium]
MNKFLKIAGVTAVLVAVIALVGAATVSAQGPNPPDGFEPPGINQRQHGAGDGLGLMAVDEADMHAAMAEALGLSLEEFEAALAEGKTPAILAQELGVDFAVVQDAMEAVHAEALQQAVDEGLITQEQADWILSHRGGQNGQGNGMGRGNSNGPGGQMGRGPGGNAGNGGHGGDCPYQAP